MVVAARDERTVEYLLVLALCVFGSCRVIEWCMLKRVELCEGGLTLCICIYVLTLCMYGV
jgi:hypothetical protein